MRDIASLCKIAVVQAAPVMFDKGACVEKAVKLIHIAAGMSAELIVFPELFIPGYPYGMTFGFTVGSRNEDGRRDWKLYYDNSLVVPGRENGADRACCKESPCLRQHRSFRARWGYGHSLQHESLLLPDGERCPFTEN